MTNISPKTKNNSDQTPKDYSQEIGEIQNDVKLAIKSMNTKLEKVAEKEGDLDDKDDDTILRYLRDISQN